ncbi:MAG: cation diffusion facilitator family transporter [Bacteroidales bacterium]|nr:cation diffusion facilitator family transporter [Bacteroidales bacterium]MBN2821252.1 cation diffusion facilitator family transporter [Bacteroidales bacterium]
MSHAGSVKSIVYALLANFGIAIAKSGAAIYTGSGAMLAEAIHSFADCGNQGLLFLGLRRAKIGPSKNYPLGHGKAIFFWSFVVALILFSMGGVFSIYEGIHKLHAYEPINSPLVAIVVLLLGVIMEGASLFGCIRQINKIKGNQNLWQWAKDSRQSELIVILGEDLAAITGLIFALLSIILAVVTGNMVFDAIGSIGIGILLVIVSFFLATKIKGLLIGQSVEKDVAEDIEHFIEKQESVREVLNLITLQLGAQVMVAVKAKMNPTSTAGEMINNINVCEAALKKHNPNIQWVFFEPDLKD